MSLVLSVQIRVPPRQPKTFYKSATTNITIFIHFSIVGVLDGKVNDFGETTAELLQN